MDLLTENNLNVALQDTMTKTEELGAFSTNIAVNPTYITVAAHGLTQGGTELRFSAGSTLAGGLTFSDNFFAVNIIDENTIEVGETRSGNILTMTADSSGTLYQHAVPTSDPTNILYLINLMADHNIDSVYSVGNPFNVNWDNIREGSATRQLYFHPSVIALKMNDEPKSQADIDKIVSNQTFIKNQGQTELPFITALIGERFGDASIPLDSGIGEAEGVSELFWAQAGTKKRFARHYQLRRDHLIDEFQIRRIVDTGDFTVNFSSDANNINLPSHGYDAGDIGRAIIVDSTDTLPSDSATGAPLIVDHPYYISTINDSNNIEISAVQFGTSISFTSNGSGTHTLWDNNRKFRLLYAQWCEYMEDKAVESGVEWWNIPQAFGRGPALSEDNFWRIPTEAELATLMHLSLANGARGLMHFSMNTFSEGNPVNIGLVAAHTTTSDPFVKTQARDNSYPLDAVKKVGQLIEDNTDFYLDHTEFTANVTKSDDDLYIATRQYLGDQYIYSINMNTEGTTTDTITFSNPCSCNAAKDLLTGDMVSLTDAGSGQVSIPITLEKGKTEIWQLM